MPANRKNAGRPSLIRNMNHMVREPTAPDSLLLEREQGAVQTRPNINRRQWLKMRPVLLTCVAGISLTLVLMILRLSATHPPNRELVTTPAYPDSSSRRPLQPLSSAANTDNRGTAAIIDMNDFMTAPTNTMGLSPFDPMTNAGSEEERQAISAGPEPPLPAPIRKVFSSSPTPQVQPRTAQTAAAKAGEAHDLATILMGLIQGNERQESGADNEKAGHRMIEELNAMIESDAKATDLQEN